MKIRILLIAFAGLFPFSLFAGPSIVGRWQNVKELESYPGNFDALVFNADGTFLYDGPSPHRCQYEVKGNLIRLSNCGVGCDSMPPYQMRIVLLDDLNLVLQAVGMNPGHPGKFRRVADPGSTDSPPTPAQPSDSGYSVQDHVQVQWQGSWYPAVILKIEGNKYLIHYDGYDASWDEWIAADRMKHQNDE